MRKFIAVIALVGISSFAFSQNEDENIKKALQTERDAYARQNHEAWKATWLQSPSAFSVFVSPYNYVVTKSWDSLNAKAARDFKTPLPYSDIKYDNYSIKTYGNIALVDYDMILTALDAEAGRFPYIDAAKMHNYQVLVKENDQWKTTSRIVTQKDAYADSPDHSAEGNLNTAGYNLISAKKLKEAIEVFKMNVKLYPSSWNTWDSLGEAYALDGNKKLAIENYEKSVKLYPKSESGLAALAKLKQK